MKPAFRAKLLRYSAASSASFENDDSCKCYVSCEYHGALIHEGTIHFSSSTSHGIRLMRRVSFGQVVHLVNDAYVLARVGLPSPSCALSWFDFCIARWLLEKSWNTVHGKGRTLQGVFMTGKKAVDKYLSPSDTATWSFLTLLVMSKA